MPVSYTIFPENRLVVVSYSGDLILEEILETRIKGAQDPDFDPSYHVIDDVSAVTGTKLKFEELSRISGQSVVNKDAKRALVAVSDLQQGMAKMYQILSESAGYSFKIFSSLQAAREWILENRES